MRKYWQDAVDQHGKWLPLFASLFAFFMPLWELFLPVLLVFFLVSWWIGAPPSFQWRWNSPLPYTIALYILHLIGMAWSTNMNYGLFDLEIKASLLLLPLIGMLKPRDTRSLIPPVILAFCLGNAVAVIAGVANVILVSAQPAAPPVQQIIFGPVFAHLLHASYFSLQLNLAIAAIFLTPVHRALPRALLFMLLLVLLLGIVLCGSKLGWITLPLVLLWILISKWQVLEIRRSIGALAIAAFLGILALTSFSSFARDRMVEMANAIFSPGVQAGADTSTEIRKLAWAGAFEVSWSHFPWGAGTGDVKDDLIRVYEERGYTHLVERRINAHSQFLQMFAALGIPGLLLVFAMLFIPWLYRSRSKSQLFAVLLLLCILNWAVESMLEVQAGVLFFAFFALLLSPIPERSSHRDPVQPPAHR